MIWLFPAAGCSILIALILKVNEGKGGNRLLLAGSNYIAASLIALLLLGGRIPALSTVTFGLGALTGTNYVIGFLVLMAGISRGPLAVPVTVMRLSVAVPVIVSILVWKEQPGTAQWLGIAMGLAAIVLFGWGLNSTKRKGNEGAVFWILMVAIFLVMGSGDLLLKAFRESSAGTNRIAFTWVLFVMAAAISWLLIAARRIPIEGRTFMLGLLLGVPNLFSTVFTLMALRSIPASIAFPFINLTVIFGSTLAGFIIWKERLGGLAVAGLLVAAAALVLLPMR